MPSVQYFNRSAPFWDFVASMEDQGSSHPFSGAHGHHNEGPGPSAPPFPQHPGRAEWHNRRADSSATAQYDEETAGETEKNDAASDERPEHEQEGGQERPQCGRGRGGWGGRGRGGCGGRGRGAWRHPSWGKRPAYGFGEGPFGLGPFGDFMQSQFFGTARGPSHDQDWSPDVDVFDTETAYVIHASLAGAKKEDIAVSWDADKNELSITGVIQRPGDEDFLKALALDERKVGAFERKVRLGSPANRAQVDMDSITAKLEDGVLRIEVPKEDKDYVEVKKVDIE